MQVYAPPMPAGYVAAAPAPMRLAQLVAQISGVVNQAFQDRTFWVVADVTNHSFYARKQVHFFELVEKQEGSTAPLVKIAAVAFGSGHESIAVFESATGQAFTNNLQVLLQVGIRHHKVQGLQLVVRLVDASFTIGQLQLQKDKVLERLCTECSDFIQRRGPVFLTRNKSLSLRPAIRRIAVISAPGSAGYQDFRHTLDTNPHGYSFSIVPFFTAVQGEDKAERIQQQFIRIFQAAPAFDVVVVIRGGGSQTDFLLFDTFVVGRVVAKFPIPVITGIGHQKNETIADQMAHTPLKTPTMAAEFILAHNRRFQEEILRLQQSVLVHSRDQLQVARQQLDKVRHHIHALVIRNLQEQRLRLQHQQYQLEYGSRELGALRMQQLRTLSTAFPALVHQQVDRRKNLIALARQQIIFQSRCVLQHRQQRMEQFGQMVQLSGPERWLRRGFALVYQQQKLITSAAQIDPVLPLLIRWADGHISVTLHDQKVNGNQS